MQIPSLRFYWIRLVPANFEFLSTVFLVWVYWQVLYTGTLMMWWVITFTLPFIEMGLLWLLRLWRTYCMKIVSWMIVWELGDVPASCFAKAVPFAYPCSHPLGGMLEMPGSSCSLGKTSTMPTFTRQNFCSMAQSWALSLLKVERTLAFSLTTGTTQTVGMAAGCLVSEYPLLS